MIIENTILINFECYAPLGKLVERSDGTFEFKGKVRYKRRPFEFAALTEFLNIKKLSKNHVEGVSLSESQTQRLLEERSAARLRFYSQWGFVNASNEHCRSESEPQFDAFHIELLEYNKTRSSAVLMDAEGYRFSLPPFASWEMKDYNETSIAVPVFNPTTLAQALFTSWFFGSKFLSNLRTCERYKHFGPKLGCQVYFNPSRPKKKFCCDECRKASHDKFKTIQEGNNK